jgi:hypothetical protein
LPPSAADESCPVASLDQLYAQAAGAGAALHARCRSWAAAAGARIDDLDLASDGAADDSDSVKGRGGLPPSLERWIRGRWIKAPGRAMRKALACYGGDVSRLVDVCRGRSVLPDLRAVELCLRAVSQDCLGGLVTVCGMKNYLASAYDSRRNGGYRVSFVAARLAGVGEAFGSCGSTWMSRIW